MPATFGGKREPNTQCILRERSEHHVGLDSTHAAYIKNQKAMDTGKMTWNKIGKRTMTSGNERNSPKQLK